MEHLAKKLFALEPPVGLGGIVLKGRRYLSFQWQLHRNYGNNSRLIPQREKNKVKKGGGFNKTWNKKYGFTSIRMVVSISA
jgi:hypothetical protein